MTNTKHTPGPWYVVDETRIEQKVFGMISNVRGEVSPHYATEANANARLIAAAPELLEACEKALYDLQRYKFLSAYEVREAIARAKGE